MPKQAAFDTLWNAKVTREEANRIAEEERAQKEAAKEAARYKLNLEYERLDM